MSTSIAIKHLPPSHPHIFQILSWEQYYRADLQNIYRKIINYVKSNHVGILFKAIDYQTFVEYMFAHSDKYKP